MERQERLNLLEEFVLANNVAEVRRLVKGVDKRDWMSLIQESLRSRDCNPPLFLAAMQGNVEMMEFLVKQCDAYTEERGLCMVDGSWHQVTPLWCAAASKKLEVVKCLIERGAKINAVSGSGDTPVLYACSVMNIDVVKFLVKYGADVQKKNNVGDTCLIKAARRCSKELCQILIDTGAGVNARDSFGNTALHWAITSNNTDKEDVVQLLIEHGSNPYLKNKLGDDVFRKASLEGQELILNKLFLQFQPDVRRRIESYELLGAHHVSKIQADFRLGKYFWHKAIKMRRVHSWAYDEAFQPNPVNLNTVEELEALSQNQEDVFGHGLTIFQRILGSRHSIVQAALLHRGETYKRYGEYRRCIDIWRYAFQLENDSVEQWTSRYLRPSYIPQLYNLCFFFCEAYRECHQDNSCGCRLEFEEVFNVLQMATSELNDTTGNTLSQTFQNDGFSQIVFIKLILQLIQLISKLDKNEV